MQRACSSNMAKAGDAAATTPAGTTPDPWVQRFADPSFDPADFLNRSLPQLTRMSSQPNSREPGAVSLTELSAKSQSLLSQLNAQNARLLNTLTQLADDIVRGGSRLAYEVEVLRGDTVALSEALTETLQGDIEKFLPGGIQNLRTIDELEQSSVGELNANAFEPHTDSRSEQKPQSVAQHSELDPEFIKQLRTLTIVRSKLEEVIQTFGNAMEWIIPPSEVSVASSFISVSAPESGSESADREENGREFARKLRTEITDLLYSDGGGRAGVDAAAKRVEHLRLLSGVWKGTTEERARTRFVDSLVKLVEDRRRVLEKPVDPRDSQLRRSGSQPKLGRSSEQPREESSGGGLFRNLQRLRDEIYLE